MTALSLREERSNLLLASTLSGSFPRRRESMKEKPAEKKIILITYCHSERSEESKTRRLAENSISYLTFEDCALHKVSLRYPQLAKSRLWSRGDRDRSGDFLFSLVYNKPRQMSRKEHIVLSTRGGQISLAWILSHRI